jgi:carbamoyl-phosphate synthase large subunit
MKKILILGAGEMQIPVIQKVNEMGYESIALDYDENAIGFKHANKKYVVSSTDAVKVLAVAKQENADALLTTSDYPVNVVAKVSQILGLPAMSPEVANICTNKYLQRKLFSDNGINAPKFYLLSDSVDIEGYKEFPYIVKPVDSSASRGVKKVNNDIELAEAIKEAKNFSRTGQVLIEQFIGGKEFSVETLTQNGETTIANITEKLVIGEKYGYFVEDTHIEPARISGAEWKLIEEEVKKALKLIKADNCPSHTEVKLWNGKPYIIEMACRLGGDYITSDLVPLSTGIDMLANLVRLSLGIPVEREKVINKVSCVQFLNPENYNRCKQFVDSKNSHIIRSEIREYSNHRIENSLDRLGYVIMQADDYATIEEMLKKIK